MALRDERGCVLKEERVTDAVEGVHTVAQAHEVLVRYIDLVKKT